MDEKLSDTVIFKEATATAIGQITSMIGSVSEEAYQEIMWAITHFVEGIVELSQEANRPATAHSNAWQNAAEAWMRANSRTIDKLAQDCQYVLSLHGAPAELPLRQLAFVVVLQTMMVVAQLQSAENQ